MVEESKFFLTAYPTKVTSREFLKLKKYARFYSESQYVRCSLCGFDVDGYSVFRSSMSIGVSCGISRKVLYVCEECGCE